MSCFVICFSQEKKNEQSGKVRLRSTKRFRDLFDVEIFFDSSLSLFTTPFSSAFSESVLAAPWEPEAISLNYHSECKLHKVTPNCEGFDSCRYCGASPLERLQVCYSFVYSQQWFSLFMTLRCSFIMCVIAEYQNMYCRARVNTQKRNEYLRY